MGIDFNKDTASQGFFMLNGVLVGIGLNDLFRLTGTPINDQPLVIQEQPTGFEMDFVLQVLLALGVISSQYLLNIKYASSVGIGMLLGSVWADRAEHEQAISITPF